MKLLQPLMFVFSLSLMAFGLACASAFVLGLELLVLTLVLGQAGKFFLELRFTVQKPLVFV